MPSNDDNSEKIRPNKVPSSKKKKPSNHGTTSRPNGTKKRPNTSVKRSNSANGSTSKSIDHKRSNGSSGTTRKTGNSSKRPQVRKSEEQENVKGNKKRKKLKFSDKHPKLMMFIKILIALFLLACVVGAGVVAGIFFGLFGDEFEISKDELTIGASNSVVVDANGVEIANLSGDEKRKIVTLEDMADYLPKAYVAIEDERFYKHSRSGL